MNTSTLLNRRSKLSMLAAASIMAIASSAMAQVAKEAYTEYEGPLEFISDGLAQSVRGGGSYGSASGNIQQAAAGVSLSFKGVSQFDLRNLLGGSFIPPDTMGAVGASQFMETTNGVYAIYSKTDGTLQSMMRADTFWANAGATGGLNGDAGMSASWATAM